jgi:Fur family ferric uptake transcriptional regulator
MARKSRIPAAVLELMAQGARHAWTLEELQADLAAHGTVTDFSSVFRAAGRLTAEGAVCRLLLEDGRTRFELGGAHHDHLHCTHCDGLIPVPCVIGREACATLEALTGAAVAEHSVILTGTCRSCRAAGGQGQ